MNDIYLRNCTEEKPPCPSNTAAKEKPLSESDRRRTSSSISSREPCSRVDPHRMPTTPVTEEGESMAMAEQQGRFLYLLVLAAVLQQLLLLLNRNLHGNAMEVVEQLKLQRELELGREISSSRSSFWGRREEITSEGETERGRKLDLSTELISNERTTDFRNN